ncbi:hypothetical protein GGI1_12018 [Acidithiobacillus sp. GGI-221]|nr:hypothetical protein GGI1_12018 [Acidithiobacillus sp. GGI-221]
MAIREFDHHFSAIHMAGSDGITKDGTANDADDSRYRGCTDGIASSPPYNCSQTTVGSLGLCIGHMNGLAANNSTLCKSLCL